MSNPRNRSRTVGAFGNAKPKPLTAPRAFRHLPPNMAVAPAKDGEDRVSDMLLDFAKPVLEQAGNNHTAACGAMNVAVLLWNAIIEGGKALEAAKAKLLALPGSTPEQVEELVSAMSARKEEKYPQAKHLVMDFNLEFDKRGGLSVRIASMNLAPKGVEKVPGL